MVFVFSLEDEISFQTVYNYYLRLCSYRNTSEVPMVLVGTQGEWGGADPDRNPPLAERWVFGERAILLPAPPPAFEASFSLRCLPVPALSHIPLWMAPSVEKAMPERWLGWVPSVCLACSLPGRSRAARRAVQTVAIFSPTSPVEWHQEAGRRGSPKEGGE